MALTDGEKAIIAAINKLGGRGAGKPDVGGPPKGEDPVAWSEKQAEQARKDYVDKIKLLEKQRDLSKEIDSHAEHQLSLTAQEIEKKQAELKLAEELYEIKDKAGTLTEEDHKNIEKIRKLTKDQVNDLGEQEDIQRKIADSTGNMEKKLKQVQNHIAVAKKDTAGWMQTFALPAAQQGLAKLDAGVNKLLSPIKAAMYELAIGTQVA